MNMGKGFFRCGQLMGESFFKLTNRVVYHRSK
jgi:hypothetical protein